MEGVTSKKVQATLKALPGDKDPRKWLGKVKAVKVANHAEGADEGSLNISDIKIETRHFLHVKSSDSESAEASILITEKLPKEIIKRLSDLSRLNKQYGHYMSELHKIVAKLESAVTQPRVQKVASNAKEILARVVRNYRPKATAIRETYNLEASYNAWMGLLFDKPVYSNLEGAKANGERALKEMQERHDMETKKKYWREYGLKLDRDTVMIDLFANMGPLGVVPDPNRNTEYPLIGYSVDHSIARLARESAEYLENPTNPKPDSKRLEDAYKRLFLMQFVSQSNSDYKGANENMILRPLSMFLAQPITAFDKNAMDVLNQPQIYPESTKLKEIVAEKTGYATRRASRCTSRSNRHIQTRTPPRNSRVRLQHCWKASSSPLSRRSLQPCCRRGHTT